MRNLLVLVVTAVCVAVVAVLYLGGRREKTAGGGVKILPGIEAKFTEEGDAGEYYGRMLRSFLGRKSGDENPVALTEDGRR